MPTIVSTRLVSICLLGSLSAAIPAIALPLASPSLGRGPALLLALLASVVLGRVAIGVPLRRSLRALELLRDALDRFSNGDFAASELAAKAGTAGRLVAQLNQLGSTLQTRQKSAEQSELLLHTLIDAAPMAILLFEDAGEIEYANDTARTLFFEGRSVEGTNFLAMLADAPAPFREAVLCDQDRLFSVSMEGSTETYHLAKRHFELEGSTHTLLMVKHLTRELRRQEIDIWKKLVRVVSHELNNSLAPIKSLVHSARIITHADSNPKLDRIYSTVEERATHLQGFVEGYARFARLPSPRKEDVALAEFLTHVGTLAPFPEVAPAPAGAHALFDRSQLEQVIINLLKNAREAGGPEAGVSLTTTMEAEGAVTFVVADRGTGMSQEVLESAMLPFFSTKEGGSGLGLAICREIVEAHGGTIRLENRDGGGLQVTCTLPGLKPPKTAPKARLTLSRVA
jgi:two-component system, NtrC family, nitrogen regulation sensor histidine kinase NtrY